MAKYGWTGVILSSVGVILVFVGNRIYYSDPYYNSTTDPVGITFIVIGVIALVVGIIVTVRARRSGADGSRASLVAADLEHAKARDARIAELPGALDETEKG